MRLWADFFIMTDFKKPGIFCFITPFASPASCKHAEKLIDCLAPNAERLFVVGDQRIDLNRQPSHVIRGASIPTLHYLSTIKPLFYSAILWIAKLIWIMLRGSWALFANRHRIHMVICFLGQYYAPILIVGRLMGKKAIIFEPANDFAVVKTVYKGRNEISLLYIFMRLINAFNRALAHFIAIESNYVIAQGHLEPYKDKLRPVNLYIDTNVFVENTPFSDRKSIVGFVGRLSEEKGIRPLLESIKILENSGIFVKLAGDGPLRPYIEEKISSSEISCVHYVGWLDEYRLVKLLNEIRLFILPSVGEGVPNSILEAMACGTPVLATAVGGIPDLIIHEETGFIMPDLAPKTIADSIVKALENPEIYAIAQRGKTHVINNYSLGASSGKWRALIYEIGQPINKI